MIELTKIAIYILTGLYGALGVSDIPTITDDNWTIVTRWEPYDYGWKFTATSTNLPKLCALNKEKYIHFPVIVHGAHELFLGKIRISSHGEPTFKNARSFYGTLEMSCSILNEYLSKNETLTWNVYSYSKYFSRIPFFPKINNNPSHANIFGEYLNLIAGGTLLTISMFTFFIFYKRVSHQLSLSICLSAFFLSMFFIGGAGGLLGWKTPMLVLHKIGDASVWIGLTLFFNTLKLTGFAPSKIFNIFLIHAVVAFIIILSSSSGDAIQLGTSIPFGITLLLAVWCFTSQLFQNTKIIRNITTKRMLSFLSLAIFLGGAINEIFAVTGLFQTYTIFSIGCFGGLLFLALYINEQISETYQERDYLRGNLENEVNRKTLELQTKTTELQSALRALSNTQAELVQSAKLASLGTLSAGIAHEINNSLNYVYNALPPIEKELQKSPNGISPKIKSLIDMMKDGLKLTFDIIKSLKNYTGLNQAKLDNLPLNRVIKSVTTILQSKIRDRIETKIDIPEDLSVYGSITGLHQVFMNLISNAIDAMDKGGTLSIHAVVEEKNARIIISDTGSGIPNEIIDKIFDPFFTTKKVGQGTGLGLHIVRTEIERHHGSISVKSEIGKGTQFIISIPTSTNAFEEAA